MKKFNLEEAKAGKPIQSRDGCRVTMLATDIKNKYPLATVKHTSEMDVLQTQCEDGYFYKDKSESMHDLFMAPVKKEGWVNIYRDTCGAKVTGRSIHESEECAKEVNGVSLSNYVTTAKVEWEE